MRLKTSCASLLAFIALAVSPSGANAQTAPAGAIFDMAVTHPTAFNGATYVQFTTSFVATATTEFISFAFRESPSYFSFDDPSVVLQGGSTNLLVNPNFESNTPANVGTNFPAQWGRWIQPVDTSAIGVVASASSPASCGASGPHTGTYFWCDGSVEGYDALYQQISGLTIGSTYVITFWATDQSGDPMTVPTIDMLVYAGTSLPVGTTPIGTTPGPATPAPTALLLVALGIVALGLYQWRKTRVASVLAVVLIVGLLAIADTPTGYWNYAGSDSTAPQRLNLQINGSSATGTMDSIPLSRGGAEGAYFWFHVNRSGVDSLYKGKMKGAQIQLTEVKGASTRVLIYSRTQ